MQAYAEGFDIMRNANSKEVPDDHRYTFDLADIANCGGAAAWWVHGCWT